MGKRFYLFEMTDLDDGFSVARHAPVSSSQLPDHQARAGRCRSGRDEADQVHATRYMVILGRTIPTALIRTRRGQCSAGPATRSATRSAPTAKPTYPSATGRSEPRLQHDRRSADRVLGMDTSYFNMLTRLAGWLRPPAPRMTLCWPAWPRSALFRDNDLTWQSWRVRAGGAQDRRAGVFEANKGNMGGMANGWVITKDLGVYGTNYMKRAVVAPAGRPTCRTMRSIPVPGRRSPASSRARAFCRLFAKGLAPPVYFWSITMYEIDKGWWFI